MSNVYKQVDSVVLIDTENGNLRYEFTIGNTSSGARGLTINQKPWEPGNPVVPWRVPLHPWIGGLGEERLSSIRTEAKSNADASVQNLLLFPPLLTAVTQANATTPSKFKSFQGLEFQVSGRYVYYFDPTTNTSTQDKDFGAGKACVDMEVFNGQLVVAMGETEKIYVRTPTPSGTADAAVTTTNTTLTDTRLALTTNSMIGAVITCNGKTLTVTSNTATVITGSGGWSGGGNPGNGNAWSTTTYWIQATDATYAIALGLVGSQLWRAESINKLSTCTVTPLTLTSWTPASPNQYTVGDTTYAVNTIIEYGGVAWIGTAKGMFAPDAQSRFFNQTPNVKIWPHVDNCKGAFVAQGYLWVPTASGLLRIRAGESKIRGPEVTHRPSYRFWVRGGIEFGGAIYLLVTDQGTSSATFICKMVRDDEQVMPTQDYRYYEWVRLPSTTKGYAITVTTYGTNPEIVAAYGNDVYWLKLGRGGGRDTDDSNYAYGTAMSLETGAIVPSQDLSVVSTLIGVSTLLDYSAAGETLSISCSVDGSATFTDLLSTQEGGGTASIQLTDGYESIRRFAEPGTNGQFFNFKFTGALTSATGTNRPEIREAWAYGYSRPRMTDVISVDISAIPGITTSNRFQKESPEEILTLFRHWSDTGAVLEGIIPDYESGHKTRFQVANVVGGDAYVRSSTSRIDLTTEYQVHCDLIRCDFAGVYAT